jgi:hypothetical protein
VLRLSGLAAAASAGLLAVCTSAGAATISGPAVPAIAGPSQVSPKATTAFATAALAITVPEQQKRGPG